MVTKSLQPAKPKNQYLRLALCFFLYLTSQEKSEAQYATKLEGGINTPYLEGSPVIAPDGKTFYFSRKDDPQNLGANNLDDIWASYWEDGQWSAAVNITAPVNNAAPNFISGISTSGDIIYIYGSYGDSLRPRLCITKKETGRTWSVPKPVSITGFYNRNIRGTFFVSADEQLILLSIQQDDAFGGRDIYVSLKNKDGFWDAPKNLGSRINTSDIEGYACMAADNRTLFFTRRTGENTDIFVARRIGTTWDKWSEPRKIETGTTLSPETTVTIGATPIEVGLDKPLPCLYFNGRENEESEPDIYRLVLPEGFRPDPVFLVTAEVLNTELGTTIKSAIIVHSATAEPNNPATYQSKSTQSISTKFILKHKETYCFDALNTPNGYFSASEHLSLSDVPIEEIDYDGKGDIVQSQTVLPLSKTDTEIENLQVQLHDLDKSIVKLEKSRENNQFVQQKVLPKVIANVSDKTLQEIKTTQTTTISKPSQIKKGAEENKKPATKTSNDGTTQQTTTSTSVQTSTSPPPPPIKTPTPPPPPKNETELERQREHYRKAVLKDSMDRVAKTEIKNQSPTPTPITKITTTINKTTTEKTTTNNQQPTPNLDANNTSADEVRPPSGSIDAKVRASSIISSEPEGGSGSTNAKVGDNMSNQQPTNNENTYRDLVKSEVEKEYAAQLRTDYQQLMLESVKNELDNALQTPEEKRLLNIVYQEKLKEQANENDQYKTSLPSTPLDPHLQKIMHDYMKDELQKAMKETIKKEIRLELEFLMLSRQKEKLQKELSFKLKQQVQKEGDKPLSVTGKSVTTDQLSTTTNRPSQQSAPQQITIKSYPIKTGQRIVINNIYFKANKAEFKPESLHELDRIVEFMNQYPDQKIEIGVFTNGLCSQNFALSLTSNRANLIGEYLVNKGISQRRILPQGYGKSDPVSLDITPQGRRSNQRVEIKIINN
jgi:outer membrane protein OmpA-like peptidoglycan-associated protein